MGFLRLIVAAAFLVRIEGSSSSTYCSDDDIGDGRCYQNNNKAACGYDGGDCCSCTCDESLATDNGNTCGQDGYQCIDPSAACVDDDDIESATVDTCDMSHRGDGYCDSNNNVEVCGYDGGDCCECDCIAPAGSDDDRFCNYFQCLDPASECVDDDDWTVDEVGSCDNDFDKGNGLCHQANNNANCDYDGGDCCSCTCDEASASANGNTCGDDGYQCIDPSAACVDDDNIEAEMVEACYLSGWGDGSCDDMNNNEICDYDGGDCCVCDCNVPAGSESDSWRCNHFQCVDPESGCVDDDDWTIDQVGLCYYDFSKGNGRCDEENNRPDCDYDGGDCCSCTCDAARASENGNMCGESGYQCIDPSAACVDDDDINSAMVFACEAEAISNGECDDHNNVEICDYDGGDCCQCDCNEPAGSDSQSYCYSFECVDPASECVNDDDHVASDDTDRCYDEIQTCFDDATCAECLIGRDINCGTSSSYYYPEDLPTCSGWAESHCCYNEDICNTNALVLAYENCYMKQVGQECAVTKLCDNSEVVDSEEQGSEDQDSDGDFSGARTSFGVSPGAFASCASALACLSAVMSGRLS